MKKLFILFIVLAGFGVSSFGQASALSVANASATIFTPLQLSNPTALNFGAIESTGGTVTVKPDNSTTGTATTASYGTAVPAAGRFHVVGSKKASYSITLPVDGIVKLSLGATDLPVTTFYSTLSAALAAPTVTTGTIDDTSGTQDFYVGATLNVAAGTSSGLYTGTYNVTVAYN